MAIKFNCPHCKKALSVKDESLAGKKAACTGCKKIIVIPKPTPAAPAEDLEAMALSALAEPKAAKVEAAQTIDFECPHCGEAIKMGRDLAGKNAQCPECRHIIRVPMPKTKDPADWRKTNDTLPAGARRDTEPAPEGAWEPSRAKGVSAQALVEAGVLPKKKRPGLTRRQKINRAILIGIPVLLLCVGGLFAWHYWSRDKQDALVEQAVKDAKSGEPAAVANQAAGEYFIRTRQRDTAVKAKDHFATARNLLEKTPAGRGRDALLADLLVSQVDLGGSDEEKTKGQRLKWTDPQGDSALGEMKQTLTHITTSRGRLNALRLVSRRLMDSHADEINQLLTRRPPPAKKVEDNDETLPYEAPEALAVIGLEHYRAKDQRKAAQFLNLALQVYAEGGDAATRPPLAPSLVALCVVLGQPEPKEGKAPEDPDLASIGRAAGQALKKELTSRDIKVAPERQLLLLATLADASGDGADVDAAVSLLDGELQGKRVDPWLVYQLVVVAAQIGPPDRALHLAQRIENPVLRGRAQFEVVKKRLDGLKQHADDKVLDGIDNTPVAQALGREALARHNGRYDGSSATLKAVEGWEDESVRPLGRLGAILGEQDKTK
jgi:hypothetical protein